MSRIWRGSRPMVGSSRISTGGLVDERLREADALAVALREVPEQPVA